MSQSFDERAVRRLEAFSDIVIGFSLAQLGASLTFDRTMTLDLSGVLAFFYAFAIICSLWYFHHRLFEKFFVPKTWPIVLNFLWLAIVVLLVFVAVQFRRGFDHRNLDVLYFGLYALAYGILAVQTLVGMRGRRDADEDLRAGATRNVAFMSLWALVFLVNFGLCFILPLPVAGGALSWTFLAGAAATIALGRYFRRRRSIA